MPTSPARHRLARACGGDQQWDLIENGRRQPKSGRSHPPGASLPRMAPIVFVSAATKQRVGKIVELASRFKRSGSSACPPGSSTPSCARPAGPASSGTQRPAAQGALPVSGGRRAPPFVFWVNDPELVHFSYAVSENRLRTLRLRGHAYASSSEPDGVLTRSLPAREVSPERSPPARAPGSLVQRWYRRDGRVGRGARGGSRRGDRGGRVSRSHRCRPAAMLEAVVLTRRCRACR